MMNTTSGTSTSVLDSGHSAPGSISRTVTLESAQHRTPRERPSRRFRPKASSATK